MTTDSEHSFPRSLANRESCECLYDRRRQACFEVQGWDDDGIALRQGDHEFYVPHSLLVSWYGSRLIPLEATTSTAPPEWL